MSRSTDVGVCLLLTAIVASPLGAQGAAPSSSVKLTGYLQPRFQASGDSASFFLRRARFAIEGQITPWASFRAQVEMRTVGAPATPPASPLTLSATDLFIKMTHERWGGTVGQFRVPFSLESLLSSTILETSERARIVNAAKRDIGAQAEWRIPDRFVAQVAVVNGEGPNHATNPDNRMAYFARAVVTVMRGLDVGGAFEGYSDSSGVNAQAMYHGRRWGARAEFIREHREAGDFHTTGWYALATYLAIPERLQLIGRVEQFDPSDNVSTDRSSGYLIGTQFFIRGDNFKVITDYELFREQVTQLKNDRAVIQLQARF